MSASLKEFITQTLSDILDGVAATHKHAHGIHVAPSELEDGPTFPADSGAVFTSHGALTFVRFDVAVTTESADDTKVGGGLKVVIASVGSSMSTASKNTEATRVQFVVPLGLPAGDVPPGEYQGPQ
jgi:predicted phage gp36 major capsid-like protein